MEDSFMPTENERKFVLLNEPNVIQSIAKRADKILKAMNKIINK